MTLKVTILKCTIQWNLVPHNIVQPPALTTYKTFVKVKVAQSCLSLCNPMDYTVHGILQTRILNWVAVPFSKGSSQLRDQTQLSWISCRFFTSWASREGYKHFYYPQKHSPHSLGSRCLFLLYPRTLLRRRDKKAFLSDPCKEIEEATEWERLEISSRKLEIPRECFMQRWAQ